MMKCSILQQGWHLHDQARERKEPNDFYEVVQHVGWRITMQQKYMIP
jgi:hypothetical protein